MKHKRISGSTDPVEAVTQAPSLEHIDTVVIDRLQLDGDQQLRLGRLLSARLHSVRDIYVTTCSPNSEEDQDGTVGALGHLLRHVPADQFVLNNLLWGATESETRLRTVRALVRPRPARLDAPTSWAQAVLGGLTGFLAPNPRKCTISLVK